MCAARARAQGKEVLFCVYEMAREADVAAGAGSDAVDPVVAVRSITVRAADGSRTPEYAALLLALGKPS